MLWICIIKTMMFCQVGFLTSSSTTRLYCRWAPRLTSDNHKCCHTQDRVGRPWLLSRPVTLYWHQPSPVGQGAGGRCGDRDQNLLTWSRALYRLSYPPTPLQKKNKWCTVDIWFDWYAFDTILFDCPWYQYFKFIGLWAEGIFINMHVNCGSLWAEKKRRHF